MNNLHLYQTLLLLSVVRDVMSELTLKVLKDSQTDPNMKIIEKIDYALNCFELLGIPLVIFQMSASEYYTTYLNSDYRSYATIFFSDNRDKKYSARIKKGSNIDIDLSDNDLLTEQVLVSKILEYKVPTLPMRALYPLVNLLTPVCGLHYIADNKFIFQKILDKLNPKDLRSLSDSSPFLKLKMKRLGSLKTYCRRVLMDRTLY